MDPVTSAICAAISAGALDNTGLQPLLKQKYGEQNVLSVAIESLEKEPQSVLLRQALEEKVLALNANEDEEILQAAQTLINVQSSMIVIGDDNQVDRTEVNINTGSGASIAGDVTVNHGDFVGHDKITNIIEFPKDLPATAPSPSSYFVGREQIRLEIEELIIGTSQSSVVAIIGMGGIGKTELAKQIVQELKPNFPGGIFWGDELPAQDANPAIMLRQWGKLCGQNLEKESDETLPSTVRGLLAGRIQAIGPVLVVVDDVRLDWSGDDLSMIQKALPPGTRMLMTTRQAQAALKVGGTIFDLDVLSHAESCQLLENLSDGKITPSDANTISELCGEMPLALVLIAQLSKRRAVTWLLERLQIETKRLDILRLDPAQRKEESVRLSFDLSYQALAEQYPESARIFRSLAVFARPLFIVFEHFINTLAQVDHRKADSENPEEAFLRLADWSLLAEEKSIQGSEMQYFAMHTLLHEYAQSLLVDTIERDEALDEHIRYCVAFAVDNPQLDLQLHQASTQAFEKSYGQLLQALMQIKVLYLPKVTDWKNEPVLAQQIIALVDALDHHWQLHSQFAAQVEWLEVTYYCASGLNDMLKEADFARRLGRVLSLQSRLDEALEWMERCQTALGEDESEAANVIQAIMLIHRASVQYQQGDLDVAEKDCKRGIGLGDDLRGTMNQLRIHAEGYNLLGVIQLVNGKIAPALEAFKKSIFAWEQVGDQYQIARVNDNISSAYFYQGYFPQAREAYGKSLAYWELFPERIELAMALTNLGIVYDCLGNKNLALNLQIRAVQISDSISIPRIQALTRNHIADLYIGLEKYVEAETYLNESLQIQTEHEIEEYRVAAQCFLAELACGRKLYQQAIELAGKALDLAQQDDDSFGEGDALRVLGQAYYLNGKLEQAREHLETGLSRLRENEYKYESYLTLQILEKVYTDLNETGKAQAAADEIHTIAAEMGLNPPESAFGK